MGPTILAKDLSARGLPVFSAGGSGAPWGYTERYVDRFGPGTIILSARGSIGNPRLPTLSAFTSTQTTIAATCAVGVEPRYLTYAFQRLPWQEIASGAAIPMLTISRLAEQSVPLAPVAEQIRIADTLDTILIRVDTVNTRMARVAPILKRFRQSVLAAATSGRLTEDWRAGRGIEGQSSENTTIGFPLSWRQVTFAEVCNEITVGYVGAMASEYVPSGVPFLRSMNVRAFRFDPKGLQFITPEFHCQIQKSKLRAGDLAIVRSGAPGVCCVIPEDLGEANCSDLVIARPGPQLVAAYGCIFMNSSFGASHVASKQVGVAQAHFNVGSMKTTPLPLPSVPEQTEIVRRVEALFAFADRLEARLQAAQTAIDRLTPSLLAKAFRGELVPQDPNDEPASELLKRLAANAPATLTRKRSSKLA